MKKTIFIIGIIIVLIMFSSCENKEYKKISATEAKEMMSNFEVIILDVREQYEYNEGHIKNAVLLPVGTIESNAETVLTDKNIILLVYCRTGRRSKEAALKLIDLGFKNVYDFGGIIDWPYETEV